MTSSSTSEVDAAMVLRLSQAAGIRIASEHLEGVARNLEILLAEGRALNQARLDPLVEPAPVFRP